MLVVMCFFFFFSSRRRHTRYIGDWSSDVCSSDLVSVNANIGDAYVMVPLFSAEEVLFNQAEAYAYTGNIAGALANLNAYASTRILNYSASNNITEARLRTVFGTSDSKTALIAA